MQKSPSRALSALVLAGCGLGPYETPGASGTTGVASRGESSRGESTGAAEAPAPTTTEVALESGSEGASGGEIPPETSGPAFDLGDVPPGRDTRPIGCIERKVDFLFIVSRYYTMISELPYYEASLPSFLETIETKFADYDRHILFANPASDWGNSYCDEGACVDGVCPKVPGYPCGAVQNTTECDWTAGAGIVFPAGSFGSNHLCPLVGGRRYIVEEHPQRAAAFDCLAHVGFNGNVPTLGDALVTALSPETNAPGGCNAGFLRDDALLVVAMISDNGSPFDKMSGPQDWYDAVAAVRDDMRSVAVYGVMSDKGLPGAKCPGVYEGYAPMWTFLDMMVPQSVFTSSCDPDWSSGFDAATDLVLHACGGPAPP